jgi:hypothetical protein
VLRTRPTLGLVLALAAALGGCDGDGEFSVVDDNVRINQIQVIGSHNSYHIQPEIRLFRTLVRIDDMFLGWEYTHAPLDEQFARQGVRQIELDVFADPDGGLYAQPSGLRLLTGDADARLPGLDAPGLKVLHVQDLDYRSTCTTLIDCLETVKAWSDAHPRHLPIMILIEVKDEVIDDPLDLGFVTPVEFGAREFEDLDAEIREVFPERQLITPDQVRNGRATLEEAVLAGAWPTLRQARGRVLFALDNGGKRDVYRAGRPALEGRVLFTNATPGDADAAFVKANDPVGDSERIPALVASGYLVRTRADADTEQARTGDTTRRDAALASGAHMVSTDYPMPDAIFGSGYVVRFPGGTLARCNPVNAPPWCESAALQGVP